MTDGRFPLISEKRLREAAGPAAYRRGEAYHADGRVEILALDPVRALARVRGTEVYRTELRVDQGRPHGACDCPAYDDAGFCKHLVALALAVGEADDAPIDRLAKAGEFLHAQGIEALVARLLHLAEVNPELLKAIEADAADTSDDDVALTARYRSAIDEATDAGYGVDWRGAGAFAEDIERVMQRLEPLLAAGRTTLVRALLDHLLDCLEDIYEKVDDSNGEIGGVVARAAEMHLASCRLAPPDPLELARWLFEREVGGDWPVFEHAAATYEDVLGPSGLAEYRRLAEESWSATKRDRPYALKFILDRFAEADGDLEARIALRRDDLIHPHGYLEVARLCAEAGRDDEALKWLDEGLWCFEDRPDQHLFTAAADLLAKAGRQAEAAEKLWVAFERWPSLALYRQLQALVVDRPARLSRAIGLLRAQLATSKPAEFWRAPVIVLLEIQTAEGLITEAWEIAGSHDIGDMRLESLADASAASHPREATAAYERLIEGRVTAGGAGNYDAAISLIARHAKVCGDPTARRSFLAGLAQRHKAKRTFITRLQDLR